MAFPCCNIGCRRWHLQAAKHERRLSDYEIYDAACRALEELWTPVVLPDIMVDNTYNMDESGFSIGTMDSTRIIIDSTLCTKYQAHPGRQEWVSFIECIYGDNTILDTFGIFKGKNMLQAWIPPDLIDKWYFSANSKGWTSNLHGLEWLRRVFDPQTRTKANGEQRLLICDSHDSHISGNFITYYIQNKITLLILPPYTSHILQPLDISIFGPL